MNSIIVVPSEKKGKFKVLYNYIQQGITYSSEIQAKKEMELLKQKLAYLKRISHEY
jgi:hypothetical protein